MRRKTKAHFFTGFHHCGSQKVFMIEGQGINAPAFTTYKSASNYRVRHGLCSCRIFSARYTLVVDMRSNVIY